MRVLGFNTQMLCAERILPFHRIKHFDGLGNVDTAAVRSVTTQRHFINVDALLWRKTTMHRERRAFNRRRLHALIQLVSFGRHFDNGMQTGRRRRR